MGNGDIQRSAGIEFAHFTAALVVQTFDALIAAELAQEEKVRELQETAALDLPHFAEKAVPLDDVEAELARLFPSAECDHAVLPGSPYVPRGVEHSEAPAIADLTGYTMKKGDWRRKGEGYVITEAGYRNIVTGVRMGLAAERYANVVGLTHRGVPRVMVDHGRVNTKLTFQFCQTTTEAEAEATAVKATKASTTSRYATTLPLSGASLPLKLMVRPADLRRPEVSRLAVNMVGEVEIVFKTVSE